MAERGETIRIGSYDVKITRPDKVLFPDDRIIHSSGGRSTSPDCERAARASGSPLSRICLSSEF